MRHKPRWSDSITMISQNQRTTNSCSTISMALILLSLCLTAMAVSTQGPYDDIQMPHQEVENWANKIGNHLFHLSNTFARYDQIRKNFHDASASIQERDGVELIKEMAQDVSNMMNIKIESVKRIMNVAEEAAQDSYKDDDILTYYNSKPGDLTCVEKKEEDKYDNCDPEVAQKYHRHVQLRENTHFDNIPINENVSSIHVPTNVYEFNPNVVKDIRWSERLDRTFKSNYELDPTLSWQYFGSSTGFLRQYPATNWVMDERDPDLYDARLRSWYIEAANSPKDIIILHDVSGSMTGLNREIAKHVVLNILETLNENDYVNVLNFSVETTALVECFNESLVQANLENIGEFKKQLVDGKTEKIANFTKALSKAFEILAKIDKTGHGAQCNQAIMLVTDGAPSTFEEVFDKYNWPQLHVRVFTYLIGRQEASVRDLEWMACANKGYFVHVTTLAEVREQVLKYIPVMARPIVMYKRHPAVWTGVYADIAFPVDVLRTTIQIAGRPEKAFPGRREAPGLKEGYRLMTSVAVPVLDNKNTTERSANLLGVAGTDIPIREIEKLVPPYKLGVNGYSFMVNKNGYILYHPDLRPVHEEANAEFQDILKPNYNSVDFAEVELINDDDEPRANNSDLLGGRVYNTKLRRDLIEQRTNEITMDVKIHIDEMKRVVTRKQWYSTRKVEGTPFSLGIALPQIYGKYQVHGQIELSREMVDPRNNEASAMNHFQDNNWALHPEWVYCEYKYDDGHHGSTPEELLKEFLERAKLPHWKWRSTRTRPVLNRDPMGHPSCDKDLFQSLLFDAKVTDVYREKSINYIEEKSKGNHHSFGLSTSFVATRSGLSRWHDIIKQNNSESQNGVPHFMKIHNKAIDEIWYKRAVDYYEMDPEAYVYSVPFDSATRNPNDVVVTATRAIFIEENNYRKAPAAVVGITMKHNLFVEYLKNVTYKCPSYNARDSGCKNSKTCESDTLDCYLLDDSGFIVASESDGHTGRFFGQLEGTIMESLVQSEVYKKVKIYDYQAVCLEETEDPNVASILATPLQAMKWTANWIMGNVFWLMVKTHLYTLWDPNEAWAYTHTKRDVEYPHIPESPPRVIEDYPDIGLHEESRNKRSVVPVFMAEDVNTAAVPVYMTEQVHPGSEYDSSGEEPEEEGSGSGDGGGSGDEPEDPFEDSASYAEEAEAVQDEYEVLEIEAEDGSGSGDGSLEDPLEDYMEEYASVLEDLYDDMNADADMHYDYEESNGEFPSLELAYIKKTKPRPCDKYVELYTLQNEKLKQEGNFKPVKGKLSNCHTNGCGRPFSVQKVQYTNLLLVAVNNLCPCESRVVDVEPREVSYNESQHCGRLLLNHFRKRPDNCDFYHGDETEIKMCGGAGSLGLPSVAMLMLLVLAHLYNTLKLHS